MGKTKDKIDLLSTMVVFHEDVKQLDKKLHEIALSLSHNAPDQIIEKFNVVFHHDFIDHFQFEEMVVFPAVKAWCQDKKYKKIIGEYIALHKDLLSEGNQIFSANEFSQKLASKEGIAQILTAFSKLNVRVCEHARNENQYIVPLIEENPALRFLSNRNMIAYQAAFKTVVKK